MAKVTYKPAEGEPDTHTQYGITWGPEPVEVTDPGVLARVRGNRFYVVEEDAPANAQTEPAEAKAVHKGFGKFSIERGDKVLVEGLSKADADAFNALSEADKAAYVEAALNPPV